MDWLIIATFAYFLVGLEVILDKFLLTSKKISHPAVYAFYSGLLSLFALVLIPFGTKLISLSLAVQYFLLGIIFVYGILLMFFAINESEASRVIPVVGAVVPVVTYILSIFFLDDKLTNIQIMGVFILIFGGLLISFELPLKLKKNRFFSGFKYSVSSGVILAVVFTVLKYFYAKEGSFLNVFMWSRLGLFIGAFSLLLFPAWRRIIFHSFRKLRKPEEEHKRTGFIFVFNKVLGGVGSILVNYAVSLGNVTIINAMVSLEYVFIFLMGLVFSVKFPKIFRENRNFFNVSQKMAAITIITVGLVMVAV